MKTLNQILKLNILLITGLLSFSGELFAMTCEYDEAKDSLVIKDKATGKAHLLSGENYTKCFAKLNAHCTEKNAPQYLSCLQEITKTYPMNCEYDEGKDSLVIKDKATGKTDLLSGENYTKCFAKINSHCTPLNAPKYLSCLKDITKTYPMNCEFDEGKGSLVINNKTTGKKDLLSGENYTKCFAKLNAHCTPQKAPQYLSCLNEIKKSAKGSGTSSEKPYSTKTGRTPKHSGQN